MSTLEEARDLLSYALYALNNTRNQQLDTPEFEDTFTLAAQINRFLEDRHQ